ncbi:MAG: hypothetical protein IPG06_22945 [Haliea sp.]|nr:hypothetical protein [Haliea sp.]
MTSVDRSEADRLDGCSCGAMARIAMDDRIRADARAAIAGIRVSADFYGPCLPKLGTKTNGGAAY